MFSSLRIFTSTIRLAPRQFNSPIIQGPIIGVDLGTFNSRVAVMDGDKNVKIIENADGTRAIPSYVTYTGDNEWIVGTEAKRQAAINPQNTFYAIKNLIGRKYEDPEIQKFLKVAAYKSGKAENGDAWLETQENGYSPAFVEAQIVKKLKESAEHYLGEDVEYAVVTVPAYFNDAQITATKKAFKLADLCVLSVIKEPTAAVLATGLYDNCDKFIAVCDFGGGTFDISILHAQYGHFKIKSTKSEKFVGGENFDNRLVECLVDEFKNDHGIDLTKNPMAMQRLHEAAEIAKCELSTASETELNLQDIAGDSSGPKNLDIKISREEYEKLVDDLIQRIKEPYQKSLNDAGIKASEIDEILLIGGMSQMPKVQKLLQEIFGREPYVPANPDEAVVRGAPIQASELSAEDIIEIISDEFEYVMDRIHALLEEHFEKVNRRRLYEMIMFIIVTVLLIKSNLENNRLKKIINNTP